MTIAPCSQTVNGATLTGGDSTGQLVIPLQPWACSDGETDWVWEGELSGRKAALIDKDGNLIGGRWFDQVRQAKKAMFHGLD